MNNSKTENQDAILIFYLSGALEFEDVNEIKSILNKVRINTFEHDRSGKIVANADDFSNVVSFVMNTPLLISIMSTIGPNALWDAIKMASVIAWKKVYGKKYTKVFARSRIEEKPITIGIQAKVSATTDYNFRFEGINTEQELNIALDKTYEFLRDQSRQEKTNTTYLGKFNLVNEEWEFKDILKEIRDKLKEEE